MKQGQQTNHPHIELWGFSAYPCQQDGAMPAPVQVAGAGPYGVKAALLGHSGFCQLITEGLRTGNAILMITTEDNAKTHETPFLGLARKER